MAGLVLGKLLSCGESGGLGRERKKLGSVQVSKVVVQSGDRTRNILF